MIAAAVATTATTTTVTKETEAKKGSRNDVKKAENEAEQSRAAPHPDNFSFNYKITKQASISINNSGLNGAWLIPHSLRFSSAHSLLLLNPFGCLPRRGCTLS